MLFLKIAFIGEVGICVLCVYCVCVCVCVCACMHACARVCVRVETRSSQLGHQGQASQTWFIKYQRLTWIVVWIICVNNPVWS